MSEIRETLVDTFDAVKNGTLPLDTARELHLIAHRHIMDRYADMKQARIISVEKVTELLKEIK